ncbi:MAG: glycine cleavage system aminomethyltransferase T [Candidatus Aramenus sulfurataquae]|jgi:aminomethyltransferase|uniref:aminomethyltransferase n=2 Tax=Candidatus Aramenus sulfurataquae TaxID=1326980 RepID=W7KWG3_9CREN|nr:MAG: glycine cleavage system aminomethyltransferase T [Candidatus Aramenus sulfurataquae]MCL7344008.1 glycine cleavage system aminomethyltransferase GcvT [Candidatus Aramenus sulfurataquae]
MLSTPLYDVEEKAGASFGEFAGWRMPMEYSSYQKEHMAVRQEAAFFDLSHMGRLRLKGKTSEVEALVAKTVSRKENNVMIGPTAFLNDRGGFVDDVMVYKLSDDEFLVVTNAVNREKDTQWIRKNSSLEVEDLTFKYVMLAIQGRKVWNYLPRVDLEPLHFKLNAEFMGEKVFLLSRSGWTGEDGIEVWADVETGKRLVEKLISIGVTPAGLITRDSLRQEMGFVLYEEDIDESVNPVEARYWVFSLEKDFIGKGKVEEYLANGVERLRVGFKMGKGERSLPRNGNKLKLLGKEVGYVTSSTYSPYLSRVIGMGYVNSRNFVLGYSVDVEVRGKKYSVKLTDFPLVKVQ